MEGSGIISSQTLEFEPWLGQDDLRKVKGTSLCLYLGKRITKYFPSKCKAQIHNV